MLLPPQENWTVAKPAPGAAGTVLRSGGLPLALPAPAAEPVAR
jgi:hypothetical protein